MLKQVQPWMKLRGPVSVVLATRCWRPIETVPLTVEKKKMVSIVEELGPPDEYPMDVALPLKKKVFSYSCLFFSGYVPENCWDLACETRVRGA